MSGATELAEAPAVPAVVERAQFPIAIRIKVKSLYLYRELTYAKIAKETGLNVTQVENLIVREGWAKERERLRKELEDSQDAREQAGQKQMVDAIASQGEELTLSGIDRAREAVKSRGKDAAKNFQSWTGAIKNLVGAIKTIRGGSGAIESDGGTVNLFFMRLESQPCPAAETAPNKVEQVTDV